MKNKLKNIINSYSKKMNKSINNTATKYAAVGVEHPQCFQILLTPRMLPVWDFVVGIFARKALLNMGWVLSTLSC